MLHRFVNIVNCEQELFVFRNRETINDALWMTVILIVRVLHWCTLHHPIDICNACKYKIDCGSKDNWRCFMKVSPIRAFHALEIYFIARVAHYPVELRVFNWESPSFEALNPFSIHPWRGQWLTFLSTVSTHELTFRVIYGVLCLEYYVCLWLLGFFIKPQRDITWGQEGLRWMAVWDLCFQERLLRTGRPKSLLVY